LIDHTRLIHGENIKPFKCDLCDYRCQRKAEMNSHMKNQHIDPKLHNKARSADIISEAESDELVMGIFGTAEFSEPEQTEYTTNTLKYYGILRIPPWS
jgi:hypothetical protein